MRPCYVRPRFSGMCVVRLHGTRRCYVCCLRDRAFGRGTSRASESLCLSRLHHGEGRLSVLQAIRDAVVSSWANFLICVAQWKPSVMILLYNWQTLIAGL